MQIEEKVNINVIERAGAILSEQSLVPVSHADYDGNGQVCLCAAGILAKAGLQVLHSTTKAERFEVELANTRDKGLLYSAFEAFGWSAQLCREMVTKNDITAT